MRLPFLFRECLTPDMAEPAGVAGQSNKARSNTPAQLTNILYKGECVTQVLSGHSPISSRRGRWTVLRGSSQFRYSRAVLGLCPLLTINSVVEVTPGLLYTGDGGY